MCLCVCDWRWLGVTKGDLDISWGAHQLPEREGHQALWNMTQLGPRLVGNFPEEYHMMQND